VRQSLDRFFDLSVGSDYPGTLIRDARQAQFKTANKIQRPCGADC
jgi:xylan 1,4-beta-xylosidase